jgi:sirohydrochlorin ferrochelatase
VSTTSPETEARGDRRAIILLAHGSRQPAAAVGLTDTVQNLAARLNVPVRGAFLENGEPDLISAASALLDEGFNALTVLPLLLYDGRHSLEDIPALLAELRRRYPAALIRFGRPLGYSPLLTELLQERLAAAGFAD